MQKEDILMSKNISDFYSISSENRKSLIIIEDINFYSISSENRKSLIIIEDINDAGHKLILLVLIIQKQRLMQNWIQFELLAGTLIKTSENEFISDQITIAWLKHFIDHTNSNSLSE
jgi:hypothetical protein